MNNITKKLIFTIFIISSSSFAQDQCVVNADKLQLFYINGMFTSHEIMRKNRDALDKFQDKHLGKYEKYRNVQVGYNTDELFWEQISEIAFHKMTEQQRLSSKGYLLENLLLGYNLNIIEDLAETFSWLFSEIIEDVTVIQDEGDYQNMKHLLNLTMDDCTRVLLITHSQGNFYGNQLFTEISHSYVYPTGEKLIDYPMLGYLGIANPTFHVGGSYGNLNSKIAKTFTYENDWVMWGVRQSFGAISPDPIKVSEHDKSYGHGLEDAYLTDNAEFILASYMIEIIDNLTPYPLFNQYQSSSSAISNFGYSTISEYLDIRFKQGGGYRYNNVPKSIWNYFMNSSSHGTYFNTHIRNQYSFKIIEEPI